LTTLSYTIATLFALALTWLIEHDCEVPVVLTHFAVFVASGASAACTTAQRAPEHWNSFLPPARATWTTG